MLEKYALDKRWTVRHHTLCARRFFYVFLFPVSGPCCLVSRLPVKYTWMKIFFIRRKYKIIHYCILSFFTPGKPRKQQTWTLAPENCPFSRNHLLCNSLLDISKRYINSMQGAFLVSGKSPLEKKHPIVTLV